MIDAKGRVTDELGMGVEGVIDAPLPPALPETLYARTGDAPVMALLALLAALIFLAAPKWRVDLAARRV